MKICPRCESKGKKIGKSLFVIRFESGFEIRLNLYECLECGCKFVNAPKFEVVDIS